MIMIRWYQSMVGFTPKYATMNADEGKKERKILDA